MILKDTSSVPIFYDDENSVVLIFPHSLAKGVKEGIGTPTAGSDQRKATQSPGVSASLLVFTPERNWLKS